jgi:RNA polymerase sigma-70 factor, ECF subfamily
VALFRYRITQPHGAVDGAVKLLPIPDDAGRAPESRAVADAIRSLRPEHRRVLLDTYYHGRSVAEAAEVLGIEARTVKSLTLSALRALKLALEARGLVQ